MNKEKLQEAMVDFQDNVSTMRAARGIIVSVGYSLALWGFFLLFYAFGFQSLGIRLDTWEIVAMLATVLAILPPFYTGDDRCLPGNHCRNLASFWFY